MALPIGTEMDQKLFQQYYEAYYKDTLGLPDWEIRVQSRFSEDKNSEALIKKKLSALNLRLPKGAKVLIIGGGTGAELIAFHALGYEAWMIEPESTACQLARQKAADKNIAPSYILETEAENLPFEDESFDLIWSFTVLEHVRCYKSVLAQIARTLKSDAWALLDFPDYRCIYEAHYKIYLPLMLPKWINAWLLKARGRNPAFYLDCTNDINAKKFLRTVRNLPLLAFCMHTPWSTEWEKKRTWKMHVTYFMKHWFDIEYSLSFYLKKVKP